MLSIRHQAAISAAALAICLTPSAGFAESAAAPAAPAEDEDTILVVTGRRVSDASVAIGTDQTSNTISITREALLSAPAGISGLKMLEGLPGFNVQANDALGLYEFGNSVFVRAFNFQQIGFVLDGVPMGRSDQFGGSPIFRYVENENLQRVTASQGAGDVSLPSYASLGPIVQYITTQPADDLGLIAQQTFGSDDFRRSFVRVDTGEHGGLSAYASYSKLDADVWRGPGTIDREHVEAKIRYEIDDRSDVTASFLYNDYFDYDSPAISIAQYKGTTPTPDPFGRKGRYFAYLGTVPNLSVTVPGIRYSNSLYNQYFKQAINSRTDYLYSLTGNFAPTDSFDFSVTGYYEDKKGYGVSPEAYSTSLGLPPRQGGAPSAYTAQKDIVPGLFAPKGLQYGLSTIEGSRVGVTAHGTYHFGPHILQAGFWGENDDYHRTQARYNHQDGNPDGAPLLGEPVHLQRDYRSSRETLQLFAKTVLAFDEERLKIELGFKSLNIDYKIRGYRNPADYINRRTPRLTDQWKDHFLPQAGLVYNVTPQEQIFASYAENMALPRGADDIFSAASPIVPGPAAETSKNYEAGVRTNRPTFNAALALFYTQFDNRLQSFASPVPGSTTTETFYQNVGGVKSYGAELSGVLKPRILDGAVYFNANATYNIAKFQDNYSTFAIKGKRVPDNAKWLVQAGMTVEPADWIVANVSARYLSSRYSNFVNSEKIGDYVIANAYVDIGDGLSFGPLKSVKLRFNVDNIFNKDYLGTISTTTNSPATYRPGPDRTFQISIRGEI
ncbi:TonB-dependent receptor [Sphingomonas oleivorans]|uniref:TonB-dependent receptor n=1 Tax=Sphingomonas oleivorans TaxID=1735121 RepID=A0A2T5FW46_9SPHN|nr:TonB-dependent receptor [Sphingomonas oleivorans]PTQ10000.1 TonB-dependent receptor [Sphingomonas oleivorans]